MAELSRTLADVVRREQARVVGGLVRLLGNIDAAEEAFQDAVTKALASWPEHGTPANPAAWLSTAAKNAFRDAARHRKVVEQKAPLLAEPPVAIADTIESVSDDELRLVFTCCHPELTLETQVALTLKVVIGLDVPEIARAFLAVDKTIAQRITRAKLTIAEKQLPYEVPGRAELPQRIAAVLAVVYLVFNEGHIAREGALMRIDLQREAWRLSRVLCDLLPSEPEVFGLFALISFALARADTRTDEHGELALLAQQDRARWDRALIEDGLMALARARRLGGRDRYVLQAEIAGWHATAPTWEATDWRAILQSYDALRVLDDSPVVALNRAVALGMHAGAAAALAELRVLEAPLARYHLFYAVRAELRRRLGEDARDDYERALALAGNEGERSFLRRQLANGISGPEEKS